MAGTGLGIAKGIEQGTNNFLQSFFAARQYKDQAKYRKLQPQIDAVNAVINDPDTPLDVKIKSMNSLPHILGSYKDGDIDLATHLGLDKLAETKITTKEAKYPSGVSNPTDLSGDFNEASTQFDKDSKPETKRRGELSANQFKELHQEKLDKIRNENDFERQYKLALVKSRLEEATLAKQGWEKNGDWSLDTATNTWQQNWHNPRTNENQVQKLEPGVIPQSVIQAQIKSKDTTSSVQSLRQFVADANGWDVEDPRTKKAAGELGIKAYGLKITAAEQRTTEGGVPKTAAQIADDKRADKEIDTKKQVRDATLNAKAEAASEHVLALEKIKTRAWAAKVAAENVKTAYTKDNSLSEEDLPTDAGWKNAEAGYQSALKAANEAEEDYQNALTKEKELKGQLSSPRNDNIPASEEGKLLNPDSKYPQPVLDLIKQVRDRNKNTKKTDDEIYAELVKAGIIITK